MAFDKFYMVPYWDKVEAILGGLTTIRQGGEKYLPRFPKEPQEDYNYRLSVSKFTNIYRDVVEGLATKPFEEEVSLIGGESIPDEFIEFIEDVDGTGNNLTTFSALTFFNGINYAIDWILVDYPVVPDGTVLNRAEARARNLKPFWSHVMARNIMELETEVVGSKEVLTYVRIYEPGMNNESSTERVFRRDGNVVTWEILAGGETVESGTLSIPVIPMVPFITGRRDGKTWNFYPAMQDAADLQITLYQDESALQYIKTLGCYPMLAANGMKPELDENDKPVPVTIGPMRVLYGLPDGSGGHGEWRFIEPSANSLEFMKKDISQTKQDLRELGRQPLTALSTQLTTVTTSIAAGKARSAVTAWALSLKDALENALKITAMFMNSTYEPEVNVYTGFDNVLDDGSDLEALATARQSGDLSQETYWFELQRRKVLSPEFKAEDERTRILNEIPFESNYDRKEEDDDTMET